MTRTCNARLSDLSSLERHMPVVNLLQPNEWLVVDYFTPGMCCSAQTLFCIGRHQRRLGNRTLETNPHTLAFCLHGGWYGHLHAWKARSTRGSCDHGCSRYSDAVCRSIHRCEDPGEFAAFLPADGKRKAAFGHNQHHHRTANFQTSHAGKEMSLTHVTIGRSMGAPEFPKQNYCELTPAGAADRRELTIRSKRT